MMANKSKLSSTIPHKLKVNAFLISNRSGGVAGFSIRISADLNAGIDKAAVHIDIPDKAVTDNSVSEDNVASGVSE